MKNSFGINIKKGDKVKVSHPRGGFIISEIKSFETKGAFVKAYGKRVILENGMSASLNDCSIIN
jgi:hypothetical protein